MTEKELLGLKQQIDDAKRVLSELKGEQTAILKQLKEEFGCSSIEEAENKHSKMMKEIEKLDLQIENGMSELEEKYEL